MSCPSHMAYSDRRDAPSRGAFLPKTGSAGSSKAGWRRLLLPLQLLQLLQHAWPGLGAGIHVLSLCSAKRVVWTELRGAAGSSRLASPGRRQLSRHLEASRPLPQELKILGFNGPPPYARALYQNRGGRVL